MKTLMIYGATGYTGRYSYTALGGGGSRASGVGR